MQVAGFTEIFRKDVENMWVYDDGSALLEFAMGNCDVSYLWALEKNARAISFYERHGFRVTEDKKFEEDTTEYLVRMTR